MRKILQQIVATCEGWEAVFFSYGVGELLREPIVCWAFMSDRPYVEDGPDEERYVEGMVVIRQVRDIGGTSSAGDTCHESCREHVAKFVANLSQKSTPLFPQAIKQIVRLTFGQEQSFFDHFFQVPQEWTWLRQGLIGVWYGLL